MDVYNKPVPPPSNHPCFFPFPPEINPPMKIDKKEIAITTYLREDSFKDENLKSMEKIKLDTMAKINMLLTPYKMAVPIFFVSIFFLPFLGSYLHLLVQAYSNDLIFRIKRIVG